MALTRTATHGANEGTASANTAVTHTITASSLVVTVVQFENDIGPAGDAATPMTVSGTAMTWTKLVDTAPSLTNSKCRTVLYAAYSNGAGSRTFTHVKVNATAINRRMSVFAFEGADTTLSVAIPTGNRKVTTTNGTNTSVANTLAGSGSMILGAIGDWNQVNAFSALANNSLTNTVNVVGNYTGTIVEPTVNPIAGTSFTWGANCAGGATTYGMIEIVPAAGAAATSRPIFSRPTRIIRPRRFY